MPHNLNMQCNVIQETLSRRKGLWRFWLRRRDCCCVPTQTFNNCKEAHLSDGVL